MESSDSKSQNEIENLVKLSLRKEKSERSIIVFKNRNQTLSKKPQKTKLKGQKCFLDISEASSQQEIINLGNELVKKLKLKKIDLDYGHIRRNFHTSSPISQFDFTCLLTLKNINLVSILKNNICNEYHYFSRNASGDNKNRSEASSVLNDFNDSFSSSKLLEDYFLIKRNINKVDFNDIFSLLRLTSFISILRANEYNRIIEIPHSISNVNYLDIFLTIFLYEENIITKYGLETSSFGLNIPRLLMKDYSSDLIDIMNVSLNQPKEEIKILNNKNIKENKMIPSARTPLKKVGLQENMNLVCEKPHVNNKCLQCEEILCLNENEIMDDFLEKLTNFTYNN